MKIKNRSRIYVAAGLLAGSFFAATSVNAFAETQLTIGDKAPALDVSEWVSLGQDRFKPVSKFEKGKVYVVEFWATWCGPCIMSMPHLASLQEKYLDKGLQIVSITDDDLEAIDKLMQKEAGNAEGNDKTYADITSHYTVGSDPDGSVHKSYMLATRQRGIPAAFIIGKDSKLEWVGHPAEIDEVLSAVLDDNWNREVFKVRFEDEQRLIDMNEEVQKVARSVDQNDRPAFAKAILAVIEKYETILKSEDMRRELALSKLDYLMDLQFDAPSTTTLFAQAMLDDALSPVKKHDLAWRAYEVSVEQDIVNKALLKSAADAIPKFLPQLTEDSHATVMDTLAHLQHRIGDSKAALLTAEKAYELSGKAEEYAVFLNELKGQSN